MAATNSVTSATSEQTTQDTSEETLVIRTIKASRERVLAAQADGRSVGVVMTMGALHEGHLSLIEASNQTCDITVVTIFVNPTQFLPGEDFEKYPRELAADLARMQHLDVDFVFAPAADEMYAKGHSTWIQPPQLSELLEGVHRPGHYRGVATIVFKLLQAVPANIAFFGHKDYQQFLMLKTMARDLSLPIDVRSCPTVREADGLALSSRNRYLTPEQREQALTISRSLRAVAEQVAANTAGDPQEMKAWVEAELQAAGFDKIDYVAIVNPDTLEPVDSFDEPALALIAAHVGGTRLIDNWRMNDQA